MTSWFVSTTRRLPESHGDVEWLLLPCATEEEAKEHASKALVRGMRIEAGTVPGIEPRVRIGGHAAHHWAQSSNPESIMGLRLRLGRVYGLRPGAYKSRARLKRRLLRPVGHG